MSLGVSSSSHYLFYVLPSLKCIDPLKDPNPHTEYCPLPHWDIPLPPRPALFSSPPRFQHRLKPLGRCLSDTDQLPLCLPPTPLSRSDLSRRRAMVYSHSIPPPPSPPKSVALEPSSEKLGFLPPPQRSCRDSFGLIVSTHFFQMSGLPSFCALSPFLLAPLTCMPLRSGPMQPAPFPPSILSAQVFLPPGCVCRWLTSFLETDDPHSFSSLSPSVSSPCPPWSPPLPTY